MITKIATEEPDKPGRFIVDGKEISEQKLRAIQDLFPTTKWIVIRFADPENYEYPSQDTK